MNIKFWIRDSGNFFNAKTGLNREQIKFLQSLKVGDRLVLWRETDKPSGVDLTLKKYNTTLVRDEITTTVTEAEPTND